MITFPRIWSVNTRACGRENIQNNTLLYSILNKLGIAVCYIEWLAPFPSCCGVPSLGLVILNRTVTELIPPYVFPAIHE